ncbi:MAG: calcium-binding protein [Hydrogenophaga sp.]|uniref:calcium-binding protein n=1 Tax=Hydrogenophaga sp. TaxID=1904254 RepID=UPI0026172E10|nr:calcium-binding protein [Hydrogenophaga sp.]MDM7943902.1 calcium-binding protein [Hydrogenophaga sp.]
MDDHYYNHFRRPEFNREFRGNWNQAKTWTWPRDPLILDLDGNGLQTVGLSASDAWFDHDGDGVRTRTGWVGQGDALLVWDRNANGSIDTGAELFGDFTPLPNGALAPNGFAALAELDTNGDGVIDASDPAFAELRLWLDPNGNAATEAGELMNLAQAGIASLSLGHTLMNQRQANGNLLARQGSFTLADGSQTSMGEFHLSVDTFDTRFTEQIEVHDDIAVLAHLPGSGAVRDLHQAAALSPDLADVLQRFGAATTRSEQTVLVDELLLAWAGSSGMAASMEARTGAALRVEYSGFGNVLRSSHIVTASVRASPVLQQAALYTDAGAAYLSETYRQLINDWTHKLHVLEAFNGQYFYNLPGQGSQTAGANWGLSYTAPSGSAPGVVELNFSAAQLQLLDEAYASLRENTYAGLVLHTRLRPYLNIIDLVVDANGLRLDASRLNTVLKAALESNADGALPDLLDLYLYAGDFLRDTNWIGFTQLDQIMNGFDLTPELSALLVNAGVLVLGATDDKASLGKDQHSALGGAGNDVVQGNHLNNILFGGAGDDQLHGQGADDWLVGGAGNDHLMGGAGSDTYRFGRGDGNDTITEDTWTPGETDRIELKAGLSADDVRLQRVRSVNGWLTTDDLVLTIRDTDDTGDTLTVKNHFNQSNRYAVEQVAFADGTVWDAEAIRSRVLLGEAEDEDLQGFFGRDNRISGGAGNDRLRGSTGADTLEGGTGNDVLEGGSGADTYRYQLGDGTDRIAENWDRSGHDVLELGAGLNPGNVQLFWTRQYHLRVVLPDGGQIVVEHQANGEGPGIEAIRFADGTQWDLDALYARTAITTDGDDDRVLGTRNDVVDGGAGNDQFHNLGGYDTFVFGLGDGHDVIHPTGGALRFKEGLVQNDVRFTTEGSDLVAYLKSSGDTLRLKDWTTDWKRITGFEFANGTVLNTSQVSALAGAGDDLQLLFGSPSGDTLTATGPRAVVHGEGGNDTLSGGPGNDVLYGGGGDDVLDGGADNDRLQGDAGRNTYVMRRGMGLDTAITGSLATAQDLVVLPEGVRLQDVTVGLQLSGPAEAIPDGNSLFDRVVIGIGQNDALVIRGFDPVSHQNLDVMQQAAQTFRFADGTELTLTELLALSNPGRLGEHYLGRQSAVDIRGSAGDDNINEWYGHAPTRRVAAGDNNDRVSVGRNDHLVSGGWGNDHLDTMGGEDVVASDAGDDVIDTGSQNDVVLFNRGDGNDQVDFGTGTDTLSFGAGIAPEDLSIALSPDGHWLILVDGGAGGSVQVRPFDVDNPNPTTSLRLQFVSATGEARVFDFSAWVRQHQTALLATSTASALAFDGSGVEITGAAALAGGLAAVAHAQTGDLFGAATLVRALPGDLSDWIHGTDDADVINAGAGHDHAMGHAGNDMLQGGAGDDVLYGGEGDDVLVGGEGNDQLLGGVGADTLWGGGGTDVLMGGLGGDTYRFELGDGNVTIEDGHELIEGMGSSAFEDDEEGEMIDSAPNVLAFGDGISRQDLVFTEVGNDLVITLEHSPQDRLVLKGFDPGRATFTHSVDVFRFHDGTEIVELDTTQVGVTEYAGDDGAWLFGTPVSDRLIGGAGHDRLFGRGGADRLAGGVGSDTYHVQASATPEKPTQTVIAEVWRPQDINVLNIDGDVTGRDLWLALEGDDLVLRMGPNGDSVRFVGFDPRVPGMQAPVERIELGGTGEVIHFNDLLALGIFDQDATLPDLLVNVGDGVIDVDGTNATNLSGTLAFDPDIDSAAIQRDLRFEPDGAGGYRLLLSYGGEGDVVRIAGFSPADAAAALPWLLRYRFADGPAIEHTEWMKDGVHVVEGDSAADALSGTNLSDLLYGYTSDDLLAGGAGEDVLTGGPGNDVLRGGQGRDAYVVNRGDGQDTIEDSVGDSMGNSLTLGQDITLEDLSFDIVGADMHIRHGVGDEVLVRNFAPEGAQGPWVIDSLEFADGSSVLLREHLNRAPELVNPVPDQVVDEGTPFLLVLPQGLFSDADGDAVTWRLGIEAGSSPGDWLRFDDASRTLYGTPGFDAAGDFQVLVQGMDSLGASGFDRFNVRVDGVPQPEAPNRNLPPTLNPDTATLLANATAPVTGNVLHNDTDPDGDTLVLLNTGAHQGLLGVLTWHADGAYSYALDAASPAVRSLGAGQTATEHFAYTATDGQAQAQAQKQAQGGLAITVEGVNDAPVKQRALSGRLVIRKETSAWQLPADAFTDPDEGDSLSYTAALANGRALPDWLAFDAASRTFVATPPSHARGDLAVKVTATDTHGASASQVFGVNVGQRGDKPKGNQGVGHGAGTPPPGHGDSFNVGMDNCAGRSGAKNHTRSASEIAFSATTQSPRAMALVDWSGWTAAHKGAMPQRTPAAAAPGVELHWQRLLASLQQLDAERQAGDRWEHRAAGSGPVLSGLTVAGVQTGWPGGAVGGLAPGAGTQLAKFNGLTEGLASLSC